jgi:hypothetical protein
MKKINFYYAALIITLIASGTTLYLLGQLKDYFLATANQSDQQFHNLNYSTTLGKADPVCDAILSGDEEKSQNVLLDNGTLSTLPITCKTIIGPEQDEFTFKFLKDGGFEIYRGGERILYSSEAGDFYAEVSDFREDPKLHHRAFVFQDVTFDGYKDIAVLSAQGAYNHSYVYLAYNPKTKTFDMLLESVTNPTFNSTNQTIGGYSLGDSMGREYAEYTYKFINGKYILFRVVSQGPLDYTDPESDLIRITKELRNSSLVEIKREIIPFEDAW